MMELWNDLQKLLKVETDITTDDASDARSLTTIRFTVSNTATEPGPSQPNVEFEDVSINIVRPGTSKGVNLGRLAAGESKSHEEQVEALELLDLKYDVEGRVSHRLFFGVSNHPAQIQVNRGLLNAHAYLQLFAGCAVHQWRDEIANDDNLVGKILADYIANGVQEVRNMQLRLQRILGMVQRGGDGPVGEHQQTAHQYLEQVSKELSRLLQEVNTGDERGILRAKERFTRHLQSEGGKVDGATDEIAKAC